MWRKARWWRWVDPALDGELAVGRDERLRHADVLVDAIEGQGLAQDDILRLRPRAGGGEQCGQGEDEATARGEGREVAQQTGAAIGFFRKQATVVSKNFCAGSVHGRLRPAQMDFCHRQRGTKLAGSAHTR